MSDMTPEKADQLRKPFPKEAIGKLPKGGTILSYVGHAATTDRLLMVDPNWSWEPLAVDERGLPALDRANNLWIKLTVCGVTRIGVGDGKSAKELIGDAIRNAAMRFGVALDLWSKEELEGSHDTAKAPPLATPTPDEPAREAPRSQRMSRSAPRREESGPPHVEDGPADTDGPDMVTKPQLTKLAICMKELNLTDKADRLAFVRSVIDREIESSTQLTRHEASRAIEELVRLASTQPAPQPEPERDPWEQEALA